MMGWLLGSRNEELVSSVKEGRHDGRKQEWLSELFAGPIILVLAFFSRLLRSRSMNTVAFETLWC